MSYTIKKGDNLTKIAKANGTTVAALVKANGIKNPNAIRAGATLNIPSVAGPIKKAGGGTYRERDGIPEPVKRPAPTTKPPSGTLPAPKPIDPGLNAGSVPLPKRTPKLPALTPPKAVVPAPMPKFSPVDPGLIMEKPTPKPLPKPRRITSTGPSGRGKMFTSRRSG